MTRMSEELGQFLIPAQGLDLESTQRPRQVFAAEVLPSKYIDALPYSQPELCLKIDICLRRMVTALESSSRDDGVIVP
jgi:hypothetical protein